MNKEKPYLETERIVIDRKYNPNYGDGRICQCGHTYYRHFDSYEGMEPTGCKYCDCYDFVEETEEDVIHIDYLMRIINYKTDNPIEEYKEYIRNNPNFSYREKEGDIDGDIFYLHDITIDFDVWLKNYNREGILCASVNHKIVLISELKGKKVRIGKKLFTI